ncbi:heparan-alpha-glucosaminide N-acetyltransferase domain-containing protein [Piscinibacter sakaiensis]|uniref:heparan-alpha-glucosaminide N-acetyltransferase domain-containing protein n=1 Tax=Piscinibacter sakaiensis TaxID=1547922 RepID=UPI003AAD6505
MIALPWLVSHPFFDSRLTVWVGLFTRKPITEDFVPLLPWMGVMWWGVAAGHWMLAHRPHWLSGPLPQRGRVVFDSLAWLGRHALSFYLLHRPRVLIGGLFGSSRGGHFVGCVVCAG